MNRKLFFSLLITALSVSAFGQTQTISFETSEGYTLGEIDAKMDGHTGVVLILTQEPW